MRAPSIQFGRPALGRVVIPCLASVLLTTATAGQGCMPMRVASPVLGRQGDVYLSAGTWQYGLAFRGYTSNQLIIGNQVRNDLAPQGQPTVVTSRTLNVSVAYALSDRFALTLNVPYSDNSHTRMYADSLRHRNTATGVGELTFIASYWLRRANALDPKSNVAV